MGCSFCCRKRRSANALKNKVSWKHFLFAILQDHMDYRCFIRNRKGTCYRTLKSLMHLNSFSKKWEKSRFLWGFFNNNKLREVKEKCEEVKNVVVHIFPLDLSKVDDLEEKCEEFFEENELSVDILINNAGLS